MTYTILDEPLKTVTVNCKILTIPIIDENPIEANWL
jgi:hypothetical protein